MYMNAMKLRAIDEEEWLPVVGWDGLYDVSSFGRIRSHYVGRGQRYKDGILRGSNNQGYRVVNLVKDGKKKSCQVHVLVAAAFIGPRPEGMDVCHGDGNPSNNRLDNLRYGTRSENILDEVAHGTHANASRTHCDKGHELTEDNVYRCKVKPRTRACRKCRAEWRSWPKPDHTSVADMVDTHGAAEILGISWRSVHVFMRQSADFPQPTRIRNRVFWDPAVLHDWRGRHPAKKAKAA